MSLISGSILKIFTLFAFLLCPLFATNAGAQIDSLYYSIDSTTFVSARNSSLLNVSSSGVMVMKLSQMQNMPKILGNTDPLQFVRLLPGVQTNSDSDSGMHIQGCGNAHNEISLGGVPVYGASHLLGLFSVFNPSHYEDMSYSTSSDFNRLGGQVVMNLPDTLQRKVSGEVTVGLMSSQGTIGLRFGSKSHLKVSARRSYLNLLYKPWLKLLDSQLRYGFGDYNITYLLVPDRKNKVWVDLYYGNDDVFLDEESYNIKLSLGWGNKLAGLHWERAGEKVFQKHSLFYSDYVSEASVVQDIMTAELPSYIKSAGYRGKIMFGDFKADADVVLYNVRPQYPVVIGVVNGIEELQKAAEGSLYFGYERTFWHRLNIAAGLKGSVYFSPESDVYHNVLPDVSVSYDFYNYGKLGASYRECVQYLFQTGLSNVGFPVEFWLMSGKYSEPQKSRGAELTYEVDFLNDALSVSVGFYGKLLSNQLEYKADLLDLMLAKYDIQDNLLAGSGLNYGTTVMVHKRSGNLTGWVGYSLGRALRRFDNPEYPYVYPANHERIHDFNAVCAYQMDRWNFSGTFIYASGTPFTAPKAFYISSGRVVVDYGEHNSLRLKPYSRLDLSVTCRLKKKDRQENGINLSIYNVLCRKNEVSYKLKVNEKGVVYTPGTLSLRFMPSINYYHKF